jgi:hypothetical protein
MLELKLKNPTHMRSKQNVSSYWVTSHKLNFRWRRAICDQKTEQLNNFTDMRHWKADSWLRKKPPAFCETHASLLCSHYRTILSQMNPIHILTSYFFKIHFNIILPSTLGISSGLFLHIFHIKLCMHKCCTSPHLILLNKTWWRVQLTCICYNSLETLPWAQQYIVLLQIIWLYTAAVRPALMYMAVTSWHGKTYRQLYLLPITNLVVQYSRPVHYLVQVTMTHFQQKNY